VILANLFRYIMRDSVDMRPDTSAEKSLPSPTVLGPTPARFAAVSKCGDTTGYGGAVLHGTSCHSVPGYDALKHPLVDEGVRDMELRQASRLARLASAAGGEACAMSLGEGPAKRPATTAQAR
jgi:hypothetical protein